MTALAEHAGAALNYPAGLGLDGAWGAMTRWHGRRVQAHREALSTLRFQVSARLWDKLRPRHFRHRVLLATTTNRATPIASTTNASTYSTAAFTPGAGELLFAWVGVTTSRDDSGAGLAKMTDSQGLGFVKVIRGKKLTNADSGYLFVASKLAAASSMTVTFDCTGDAGAGCIIFVCGISSMTRTGIDAVRQTALQDNQAAASTPAPAFASSVITSNVTSGFIHNATSPAGMTPPTSWTELTTDVGYSTPTTGGEYVTRDSGFTGTTVTWGSTSASAYGSMIVEFDTSAATFTCPYVALVGAVSTAIGSGNFTVAAPAGIVSGDICVIVLNQADQVNTTLSDGAYTQKWSQDQGTALRQRGFWKRSSGSESNVTVTHTGGDSANGYMVVVRQCVASGDPFDVVTPQANASSATITSANVTPAADPGCVLFCATEELTGNTSGAPTMQVWTGTFPTFMEIAQGKADLGANMLTCGCAWGGSNSTGALGARTVTVSGEATTPTGNIGTIAILQGDPVGGAAFVRPLIRLVGQAVARAGSR